MAPQTGSQNKPFLPEVAFVRYLNTAMRNVTNTLEKRLLEDLETCVLEWVRPESWLLLLKVNIAKLN